MDGLRFVFDLRPFFLILPGRSTGTLDAKRSLPSQINITNPPTTRFPNSHHYHHYISIGKKNISINTNSFLRRTKELVAQKKAALEAADEE